ncbi:MULTISPECIES: FAD-dependent monooxygenase [Nocardiaceae]|uniref:FAD-dependent monooxygenase n=1 Tax=Nocardiaceae TaxID=85025 RepID=UPI00068F998D|nr:MULTISPECIES: FAD-dependent monooxygenase [Rhodococcus]
MTRRNGDVVLPGIDVDVVIIGLGPTGATAANLLGQLGIRTVVVERDISVYPRQRAIASDEDAHRVWQGLGLFDEMLATMSSDVRVHFKNGNRTFLSMTSSQSHGQGVPGMCYYHQPELERVLRQGIDRFPTVTVMPGYEAVDLTQDEECAIITLRRADGGQDRTITERYVIACDGGSSSIRKLLEIALPGKHIEEPWFDIQLRAWYNLPIDAPLDFTFIADPSRPGVDCPCPIGYHRVEFRVNKGETIEQLQTETGLRGLLAERGIDFDQVEIYRSWGYTFHIRQAERWSKGRVFLAGDAARIMPPFAGQGVSSGVRDVANLCWKIGAVLNAFADPDLLATYERERRPNVTKLTQFSLRIGGLVMLNNGAAVRLRDSVIRNAMRLPVLSSLITSNGLKPRYELGTDGGLFGVNSRWRSPRGSFIEQPWVTGSDLTPVRFDALLDNKWTWMGFPSAPIPPQLAAAGVNEVKLEYSSAIAAHRTTSGHYVDSEGVLERQMRRSRVRGVLVRPDRFIYCSNREISASDYERIISVTSGIRPVP